MAAAEQGVSPLKQLSDFLTKHKPLDPTSFKINYTSLAGGSYYINANDRNILFDLLAKCQNKPFYFQESFPLEGVFRPVLDIDGKENDLNNDNINAIQAASCSEWRKIFSVPNEFKFETTVVKNDKRPDARAKIYFHNLLVEKKDYLDWIDLLRNSIGNILGDNGKTFDAASGNRLIFAYKPLPRKKVDGRADIKIPIQPDKDKGRYVPKGKPSVELYKKFSIFPENDNAKRTFELNNEYSRLRQDEEEKRLSRVQQHDKFQIIDNDQAKAILDALNQESCDTYYKWRTVCLAMRNLGVDKQLILDWSRKSSKFDSNASDLIDRWWHSFDPEKPFGSSKKYPKGYGVPILKHFLKLSLGNDNYSRFQDFHNICDVKYEKYLVRFDQGIADLCYLLLRDKVKFTYESGDYVFGYLWDESKKIWVGHTRDRLTQEIIAKKILPIFSDVIKQVSDIIKEDYDKLSNEEKKEADKESKARLELGLRKRCNRLLTSDGQRNCMNVIKAKLEDIEFKKLLNKTNGEHTLPIRNGKLIDLKTGLVRDRTIRDYWTFELTVDYIPEDKRNIKRDPNLPTAEEYLKDLTSNNELDYLILRKIVGYCFTRSHAMKIAFNFIGEMDAGKSQLLRYIIKIIGGLAKPLALKTFCIPPKGSSFESNHNDEEKFALQSAVISYFSETPPGSAVKEDFIKRTVGNDSRSIRGCGQHTIELVSDTHIIIISNDILHNSGSQNFIDKWRPFRFYNKYKKCPENEARVQSLGNNQDFLDDLFSIFADGARLFFETGTIEQQPGVWEAYQQQANPLRQWLSEKCEKGPDSVTFRYPLDRAYQDYCSFVDDLGKTNSRDPKESFKNRLKLEEKIITKNSKYRLTYLDENCIKITEGGKKTCLLGIRPLVESVIDDDGEIQRSGKDESAEIPIAAEDAPVDIE